MSESVNDSEHVLARDADPSLIAPELRLDTPGRRNVIEARQYSDELLDALCVEAAEFKRLKLNGESLIEYLPGRSMLYLFFQPSSRTLGSFESAAAHNDMNMWGQSAAVEYSSVAKGESFAHTARTFGGQGADVIILRHPEGGAALEFARHSGVTPVINAGDGRNEHPTQALLDYFTIREQFGATNGLNIVYIGDNKSRVVRSGAKLLARGGENQFTFISPTELAMEDDSLDEIRSSGSTVRELYDQPELIDDAMGEADIVYITRLQTEYFNREDYEEHEIVTKLEDLIPIYRIDERRVDLMQPHARLYHPLPINKFHREITEEVTATFLNGEVANPKVGIWQQTDNGLFVRHALLRYVTHDETFGQALEAA